MKNLQDFRREIDKIDLDICKVIAKRFAITHKVGIYKLKNKLKPEDKNREAEIMEKFNKKAAKLKLNPSMLRKIYKIIIKETKNNYSLCHSREGGNPEPGSRIPPIWRAGKSGMTN